MIQAVHVIRASQGFLSVHGLAAGTFVIQMNGMPGKVLGIHFASHMLCHGTLQRSCIAAAPTIGWVRLDGPKQS